MAEVSWYPIRTQADWDRLNAYVCGFHDGVIKEMHWSHGEFVDLAGEMVYGGRPTLWILVQLQLLDFPAVELRFAGVTRCSISTDYELEVSARVDSSCIKFSLSSAGSNLIIAESCDYRFAGADLLGAGPFAPPWLFSGCSYSG